jgi:hypothetical protein
MSFLWSRAGDVVTSRCTLCGYVLASRLDRDIHAWQRAHDAMTCQLRRAETTRAIEGQAAAAKWASHDYLATRRNTARRHEKEAS